MRADGNGRPRGADAATHAADGLPACLPDGTNCLPAGRPWVYVIIAAQWPLHDTFYGIHLWHVNCLRTPQYAESQPHTYAV